MRRYHVRGRGLKRRSRACSRWWVLVVPVVSGLALLRWLAQSIRNSPPHRGHRQDLLSASPSPPLPLPPPPQQPRLPPPQPDGRLRHQTPEGRLRHVQCTSAAQRAVKKLDRVPLLMSSVQAAKQSNFDTETPLPTAGLAHELLPASSRLDANGFGERRTCAVVGASGSLLAARQGALIDAHQQVIRINRVVTRGFEEHV